MIIIIQAQYKLKNNIVRGQLSLTCTPWTIFLGCKISHYDPLNAKQSSKKNLPGLCENAWFPWQPIMRFNNRDKPTKLLIS